MRLIDADALKITVEYGYDNKGVLLVPYRDIKKSIEATKTVDAVPVVRCRDCRKFKTYGCRMVASGYDDFCSYGERKGGDGDA